MKIIIGKIGPAQKIAGFSGPLITLGRTLPILEKGEVADVLMVNRKETGNIHQTNVPRKFTYSDQDAWGYGGNGPTCFSQNLMFHFTGGNDAEARELAGPFLSEVISNLPNEESCVLHAEFIQTWIEFQKTKIAAEKTSA